MGITPHNRISTRRQKFRGRVPRSCRTILNKLEGGTLYQKTRNPLMIIPRHLRNFGKQPGPTGVTPTNLLWFLPAQGSTHDLSNSNQMANKTNTYCKNTPGRSLPPDTCKLNNRVGMHFNSRRDSLSLPEVTIWHHTRSSRIYDC